jgi:hypothetical protein
MSSTFSWLDHSDRERQRMLDAIERLAEKETRDELGLGAIRDGLSDLFFPGTNTIQTRARYFLFVPWIYRAIEAGASTLKDPAARGRRDELALIEALCASGNHEGVIGARARNKLKRLPSNIYWLGLGKWGIRRFPGSQEDYHQRLRSPDHLTAVLDDDADIVEGSPRPNWHRGLPDPPEGLLEATDLRLSGDEAIYLRERIRHSSADSLLHHLLNESTGMQGALPWLHPACASLPSRLAEPLAHARLFSETMYGAALLYNLLLLEASPPGEDHEQHLAQLRSELTAWCIELQARETAIKEWDRRAFWALVKRLANVRESTERFVSSWWDLATWRDSKLGIDSAAARDLIRNREQRLKGSRSRLGNLRALEHWQGAAGLTRLNYRWGVTTRIINDIHAGLGRGINDARTA